MVWYFASSMILTTHGLAISTRLIVTCKVAVQRVTDKQDTPISDDIYPSEMLENSPFVKRDIPFVHVICIRF